LANYYEILGLPINASQWEVRRAFREKAKCFHPDINNDFNAKFDFQKINEAYQVLINSNKRRIYDIRLKNGTPYRKVYYRSGNVAYRHNGARYVHRDDLQDEGVTITKFEKYFDFFLFLTLTLTGAYALLYGLYRLFVRPVEQLNPYPGIILGVFFTSLMIYVWNKKIKMLGN
jgi:curved DNA-binding protein CbpA